MKSFKILLALLMVKQNVDQGSCGAESGIGRRSIDLDHVKSELNLFVQETLQHKEAMVKVYLAAVSVDEAGDVVNSLMNALSGSIERPHPISDDFVSFPGCESSSPNITGTPAEVTFGALEGIDTELGNVANDFDATKLNCSINIAQTLVDGFSNSSIVTPNDDRITVRILHLARSVLRKASNIKPHVETIKAELVATLEDMNQEIERIEAAIVAAGGTVPGGEAPTITLYGELNEKGVRLPLNGPSIDLRHQGFNDVTVSIRGKGLWFLYKHIWYSERLLIFPHANITSHNLVASQWNQASSLRYAGSDDMSMEVLTLYRYHDQCGPSYIAVADINFLLVFNDEASSLVITGNSAWTLYTDWLYGGDAVCIKPRYINGLFYGYWNMADIKMKDNVVSSIRKGCHSSTMFQF